MNTGGSDGGGGDGSGFSAARLERLHEVLAGYVQRGEVAGVVTLLDRHGHTRVDAIGCQDRTRGDPIRRDSLFRIASMTKPITAVAAMILVEECRLRLDDPIDALLPELANRRVLRRIDSPLEDTEPARRALTLRDLLTFRLGTGVIIGPPDRYPIQRAMSELQLIGRKPAIPHAPDEWIRRLGTLPLIYQPGERWLYHFGSEVLGVLIARASGQPFEVFLRERLFAPLGMADTGFQVPADRIERLASCYQWNPANQALEPFDDARDSQWSRPPTFPSGGSGLVSSADDYLAFGRMMLHRGRLGGTRILARPTVEAMLTDYLTAEQKIGSGFYPGYWDNRGWGFGLAMVTRRDGPSASPGRFGWDGVYGTSWTADPAEDMVAMLMIQRLDFDPRTRISRDFWTLVYQAIDD
ncbi:MAG TPA: serine hydrolase domain-containing protein [Steroidobacteraceae bacterium]|jgi:CubicO group peptidase (beta-lactamase class C family)|nr:serine hydrolase domain-containing protein [Steroidobacteraceae bacterium]